MKEEKLEDRNKPYPIKLSDMVFRIPILLFVVFVMGITVYENNFGGICYFLLGAVGWEYLLFFFYKIKWFLPEKWWRGEDHE